MSAWLGPLLGALVAAVAVIATNLLNRRDARILREDERRQRRQELERAANEAAEADLRDHRRKMDDQWRDARLEAHLALLSAANEAIEVLEPIFNECFKHDSRANHPEMRNPRVFTAELTKKLESALARVEIVGSEASSAAARQLTGGLIGVDSILSIADAVAVSYGFLRSKEDPIRDRRADYLDQIRADLGTAD